MSADIRRPFLACPAQNERSSWDAQVRLYRVIFVVTLITSFVYKTQFDLYTSWLWAYMRASALVKFDTFEPILSTASFFVWINTFRFIDAQHWFQQYRMSCRKPNISQLSRCRCDVDLPLRLLLLLDPLGHA
eukprot:Colp12_sorted_trinity150504_noHs@5573